MQEPPVEPEPTAVRELRRRLLQAEAQVVEERLGRAAAEQRGQWALTLFAAVTRLCEGRTLEALYAALDDIALALLDGRELAVYVEAGGGAQLRQVHGATAEQGAGRVVLGEGIIGRAAAECRTLAGPGADGAPRVVAIPLGAKPALLGALVLLDRGDHAPLDADHLQLLEIVARHTGYMMEVLLPRAGS